MAPEPPRAPPFDPRTARLPSQRAPAPPSRERPRPSHRSSGREAAAAEEQPVARLSDALSEQPARVQPERVRRRRLVRRTRRTVKHVDPVSVLKLSLFYYAALLVIWLFVVAILYGLLEAIGVLDGVRELARGLVVENFEISLGFVEKWAFILGLVFAVFGSIINVFLAALYNVGADLVGGLEVTFLEREF